MTSTADLKQPGEAASSYKTIKLEVAETGIATLTIDLPDSKVNTLGLTSMTELNDCLDKMVGNSKIKGLIIRSGKQDGFIAGADVTEVRRLQNEPQIESYKAAQLGKEVFARIDKLPYPVVAAINGVCLGGGTELTLACDHRIIVSKAKIGLPEVMLGLIPGWGGCIRLPKLVGVQKAIELIMAGTIVDARKAWKFGLVDEIVEPEKLYARAAEIAGGAKPKHYSASLQDTAMKTVLETNPIGLNLMRDTAYKALMRKTKGKFPAPKEALNVIMKGLELPEDKAFDLESRTFSKLAITDVSKNLVAIFFAQTDSKKLPEGVSKPNTKTVAVLGAGVMGAGIAQAAAKAGYKVVLKDIEQKFLDKGKATISGLFDKLVERKKVTREEADGIVNGIVFTTSYEQLSDCDLVIEAVIEDLKVKQEALAECDRAIKKPYVFATNTSSLSVDKIAAGTNDPSKVVGIHFFNPVHKMPLVEIVRGAASSKEALAVAIAFAVSLNRTATDAFVTTKDAPGFVVNRILAPYLREAAVLAEEGVSIQAIDKAMKSFGMPMGPFELLDEIGLDVAAKVVYVMNEALGERMSEPALLKDIVALKLLGKKGGKGIYLYNEKGKPSEVNPDVLACIKHEAIEKSNGEIQDRLVLLMLNEAARCLEEKVVNEPQQLDLAMIFGTGYPPFQGGILKYADATGIQIVRQKLEFLSRVVGSRYSPCALLNKMADEGSTFYGTARVPVTAG